MIFSHKLIEEYRTLKREVQDCILLMQVGVFMHVLDDDARAVSEVTGLKQQLAGEVDDPVVLVPYPATPTISYHRQTSRGWKNKKFLCPGDGFLRSKRAAAG